jgi:hypothetical protein
MLGEWLFAFVVVLVIGRIWRYDMADDDREADKQVVKEALKEWLDEKFMEFGKWTISGIAALVLAAIAYMILVAHGWRAPL